MGCTVSSQSVSENILLPWTGDRCPQASGKEGRAFALGSALPPPPSPQRPHRAKGQRNPAGLKPVLTRSCPRAGLGPMPCPSLRQIPFLLYPQSLLALTLLRVNSSLFPAWAFRVALVVKNPHANAGEIRDVFLIPGSGRSPGGRHSNPFQYSCLENPHGQRNPAGYDP